MRISAKSAALALGLLVSAAWPAMAEKVTVKDVTGRDVEVNVPVSHVILGEGRQIYFLAALDKENPFQHVVGWRDDLAKADPETYAAYLAKYPDIAKLPTFGGMKDGTFDIEQAISLKPDVILMNIDAKTATQEAGYIEKLEKVGIPLVYVDFREKPMENTEPSMRLMGKLTGKEKSPKTSSSSAPIPLPRSPIHLKRPIRRSPSCSSNAPAVIPTIAACPSATRILARWSNLPAASTWPRTSFPARSATSIRNRSSLPTRNRSSSRVATGTVMFLAATGSVSVMARI